MNRRLLIPLLLAVLAVPLAAHPHMLLLTRLDFDISGTLCRGFWVEWGFDPFFSSNIIGGYDTDGNGRFDRDEVQEIHDRAFINLANYGYFVFIRRGTERIQPDRVEEFTAWQKENQLFYRFFVPLDQETGDGFAVSIFDPTFYCAVRYQETPATLTSETVRGVSFRLEENRDYPVYYNPLGSMDDTRTYSSWKKGLETAYPEEIRILPGEK